jgi:dipeptidyl aminopeptidase/acylaminoacyl peptidase
MTRLGSVLGNVDRSIDPRALMRYAKDDLPDVPEDERAIRTTGGSNDGLIFGLTVAQIRLALIGVAGVLVVLIVGLLLLPGGDAPSPTPTQIAALPEGTAESTAEAVPPTATATPTENIIVVTRAGRELPTNTPTVTPTPTITPTLTPTLPAVEQYTIFYTATDREGNNLSLYRMQGDSSGNESLVDGVLEVVLDPTGQRIAYTRGVDEGGVLVYQLFVGPLDNPAAARQVTNFPSGNVTGPSFSPDGQRILFASNSDGDDELYLLDTGSGSQSQITVNETNDAGPDWGPSGLQVVYSSDIASPPQSDIYRLDFRETGSIQEAEPEILFDTPTSSTVPVFSPDGQQIAYINETRSGSEVIVGSADGTRSRSITGAASRYLRPVWSPDGRYVYYISDERTDILQIYYALPDGTFDRRVLTPGLVVQSVAVR